MTADLTAIRAALDKYIATPHYLRGNLSMGGALGLHIRAAIDELEAVREYREAFLEFMRDNPTSLATKLRYVRDELEVAERVLARNWTANPVTGAATP